MRRRSLGRESVKRRRLGAAAWLMTGTIVVAGVVTSGCGVDSADSRSAPSEIYRVPSESMEPTLRIGTKVAIKAGPLRIGEIVVFHPPEGALQNECGPRAHVVAPGRAACDAVIPRESRVKLIKRIVAGPGDEIDIRDGHVYRRTSEGGRFVRESDPYIMACGHRLECSYPVPILVPAGHWFLMGDNRGASDDSRTWGPVPTAWIVGIATRLGG